MDQQSSSQTSSTPQIRSRITVVCAECKRLKLKCDRRSPCSSCTKRDTVARCIYSPAAAEKVDLHSLNNRLMQVEATLAQLTAGTFQSSYPPAHPQNIPAPNPLPPPLAPPAPNPHPSRNIPFPSNNHHHNHHPAAVTSHVHDAPCPLALSLDELRSAWLDSVESSRSGRTPPGRPPHPIKSELSPADVERQITLRTKLSAGTYPHSRHPNPQPFLPPPNTYFPPLTQSYGSPSYIPPVPSVTSSILDLLPSTATCIRILARAKPILAQRPVPLPGGWARFEQKAISLLSQRTCASYSKHPMGGSTHSSDVENETERPSTATREKKKAEEGLPFFSITTAVLAIGASVSPPEIFGSENVNAGFLHALSQQALSVWETSTLKKPEKDYVLFLVACLAGIGYLLLTAPDAVDDSQEWKDQEGNGGKPRAISSLVSKVVSIAREIGLGKEKAAWQEGDNEARPSSRPDARRAWEDFRRVVWWDIMFYDLFASDALGHPSLIPPLTYSVNLPELAGGLYDSATKKYVIARCRLVQIAQRVKHRLSHPDCCCGYTFDQAASLEDEIRRWSRESISQDDDEKADERRHSWELSLAAQVLVLRVYVPFLISGSSAASVRKHANGASGPGKVSGKPALVEKPQIQGNAMAMATQSCLGAAQAILRLGNKLTISFFKEAESPVGPLLMDLYPLERMVLDAVVITQSSTAVSVVSEAEVRRGMEILMDKEYALGKERGEIWESMKQRVHVPSKLQIPQQGVQPSIKRKHDQLSPVATNSNDVTLSKKLEGLPSKHAKTSASPLPVFGVRYRQGRMGPSGPIRPPTSDYDRRGETPRSYTLSNAQPGSAPNGQMSVPQLQQHPIPPSRQVAHFHNSLSDFPSEQSAQTQSEHIESSMNGHRNSFDQTSSRPVYNFDEAHLHSPAYPDHQTGVAVQPNSTSSSPYQPATPSYNPPHFSSPDNSSTRTPTSQLTSASPTISYGSSDGQSSGAHAGGGPPKFGSDPRPAFENPRPTFITENPQPQVFDKMYSHPGENVPSSAINTTSAGSENPAQDSGPSHFGVTQQEAAHPSAGYFHPGSGLGSYDTGGMLQLGMRMEDSMPGTPIYEKAHVLYEKAPQHQMLQHNGHSLAVNGHNQHQHSLVANGYVGDHVQALAMSGGPQSQHQPWSSNHPPQALVGVSAGQPYW